MRLAQEDLKGAVIQLKNALEADPDYVPARVLLGQIYVKLGYGAAAEKELEAAHEQRADRSLIEFELARAYLLQEKYEQVLAEFELAGTDPGRDAKIHLARGQAYLGLERLDEAMRSFAAAELLAPGDAEPLAGQAQVLLALGRHDTAEKVAERATTYGPDNAQAWQVKAEVRRLAGDLKGAVASYDRALAGDPHSMPTRISRAAALVDLGRYEAALEDIEFVRERSPDQPHATYLMALVQAHRGDFAAARDTLIAAQAALLTVDPRHIDKHAPTLLLSGLILFSQGGFEGARQALERYLQLDPGNVTARKVLGAAKLRLGELTGAIDAMEPALETAPDDLDLLTLLASAHLEKGQYHRATALLERAAAIAPQRQELRMSLARSRIAIGLTDVAIEELEAVVASDPDAAEARTLLIQMHLQEDDHEAALNAAGSFATDQPENPVAHNLLGAAFLVGGDIGAARESFQSALRADPGYVPARLNLARTHVQEGDTKAAKEIYDAIVAEDSQVVEALLGLARVALMEKRLDDAVRWLDKTRAVSDGGSNEQLALADLYLAADRKEAARDVVVALSQREPENPLILVALARTELAVGDREAGKATLRLVAERSAAPATLLLRTARLQLSIDDVEGARVSLEEALRGDPRLFEAKAALAIVLARTGKPEAGLQTARELRSDLPDSPLGDTAAGDVLMLMGRFEGAAEAYALGRAKEESSALALRHFQALHAAGEVHRAASSLAHWVEAHPEDHRARKTLAAAQIAAGQLDLAARNYDLLLETQPDDAEILNNLAWLRHQLGGEDALALAQRAYELNPQGEDVLDTLGWILVQRGEAARGLVHLRDALVRAPQRLEVRYHIAAALHQLGRNEEARRELEGVISSGREFSDMPAARALLEQLSAQ